MTGILRLLLLLGAMLSLSTVDGFPALSPAERKDEEIQEVKSDYPSIVPVVWPESTSPPSPERLHDDDDTIAFYSPVPSLSSFPSLSPSMVPSDQPSSVPSDFPSAVPSDYPSSVPSDFPSSVPSDYPSSVPSDYPSAVPSDVPSMTPTSYPSETPSTTSSLLPSNVPSVVFEAFGGFVIDDAPQDITTPSPTVGDTLPETPSPSSKGKGKSKSKKKMRRTAMTKSPKKFSKIVRLLRKRVG